MGQREFEANLNCNRSVQERWAKDIPGHGERAPEIAGPAWVNSEPLSLNGLRGRVILVEFWTSG